MPMQSPGRWPGVVLGHPLSRLARTRSGKNHLSPVTGRQCGAKVLHLRRAQSLAHEHTAAIVPISHKELRTSSTPMIGRAKGHSEVIFMMNGDTCGLV